MTSPHLIRARARRVERLRAQDARTFLEDLARAVDRVVSQIRTRRKLAESEERLAGVTLLAEAIPQIVWTATSDGRVDYANRRWFEYSGLTPASNHPRAGIGWLALHPDDLSNEYRAAGASAVASRGPFSRTNTGFAREGPTTSYRWFLVRAELVQ